MSFTSILLLLCSALMAVIVGIFLRKKFHAKKIVKIIILALLVTGCVFVGAYQYFQRSSSFIFTKTTNLSEENIGNLRLYESIDSKDFVEKYGTDLQKGENVLFDYYRLNDGLVIATNPNRQIIRIVIDDKPDSSIKTGKGINPGRSVDDVIQAYGENYYKRTEDGGVPVIGYVDKEKKATIEFFNYENKVTQIRYDISSMQ